MKKIIIVLAGLFMAAGYGLAATPQVKKVTFFPLPYASYYQVNATTLEVGVGMGSANGTLGNSNLESPLNVKNANDTPGATHLTSTKTLTLDSEGSNSRVLFAADSNEIGTAGEEPGRITFTGKLRLVHPGGSSVTLNNLNAATISTKTLTLFGKPFPACEAGDMHWVKLKLGPSDACSWYLACGAVDEQCGE